MKNIITLLIAICAFGLPGYSQSSAEVQRTSFGIYGGINFQNINGSDAGGSKLDNSQVIKYHFGINLEIPLAPEFVFQPGLQFISKGTSGPVNYNENSTNHAITRELSFNYIELPINLIFKPLLGTGHLILGFGPYIGYAISGNVKFSGNGSPADRDIEFVKTVPGNSDNNLWYFKRIDAGANFFVGYEMNNGLNLVLNSQLGMININSDTDSELANKNTGYGLSLGYRF